MRKLVGSAYFSWGVFLVVGVTQIIRGDALPLFFTTLLFIGAVLIVLRHQARQIQGIRTLARHLEEEDAARTAKYFGHLKEQLLVARRIYGTDEYRRTLESLLETYAGDPVFREHIAYVQGELESL